MFSPGIEEHQGISLLTDTLNLCSHGISLYDIVRDANGHVVDFRLLAMNTAAEQLHGIAAATQVGRLVTDILPGIHSHPNWGRAVQVATTGVAFSATDAHAFPLSGVQGRFRQVIQPWRTGISISYEPQPSEPAASARSAVEQKARLFDSVLAQMLNGLLILRIIRNGQNELADMEYLHVSQSLAQHGVADPQRLVGKRMRQEYPATAQSEIWRRYQTLIETGQPQRFEEYYRADGLDIWMDISLTLLDADTILSIYQPICDLKHYQHQLEEQNQLLSRTNENLQQFAYVASHDLKEPLRKIQSFGDILATRHGPQLGENGLDLIRRMQSSAARMTYLVQDLLTYSRLTTHRQPHAPVDLSDLVRRVLIELQPELDREQAHLQVPALPQLPGDPPQLFQLFFGLLSNAIKFRKTGVRPRITLRHQLVGRDHLPATERLSSARMYHRIDVIDNGIGFDPIYTSRIFTIFQRLHSQAKYPGTGIGLAICKKVADNHGGCLTASSQPGHGATFSVFLPA